MALKTRLTDLLKVQHPIMLAGMGGVSYAEVCAAMCNAGGYGVLGMAGEGGRTESLSETPSNMRVCVRKL